VVTGFLTLRILVEKKMRPIEIARLLGYSKMHIYRIIQELLDNGVIKRVKRGKYKWNNKRAKPEKKLIVESRQMTPQQLIEFAKETRVRVVHDKGTLVVEYEDDLIRRVIVSSLLVEEDRVVERIAGRTRIYLIPRNRLRQLLNNPVTIRSQE
jgi:DNA-binding Lrp family transcriptional regulator